MSAAPGRSQASPHRSPQGEGTPLNTSAKRPRARKAATSPEGLTHEKIVAVALALIAEKGLDAFSLRDVARSLGVYPTALYWYFPNKNALLGEVCTVTMAQAVPPRGRLSWQDWLRALFRQYRKTMRKHPNMAQLVGARLLSNSENNTQLIERILQALEDAGCPDAHIVAAYNAIVAAMCGYPTMEFAPVPSEDTGSWQAAMQARTHEISALRYPVVARHLPALVNRSFILRWQSGHERPLDAGFEAYVAAFVGGLEQQIHGWRASTG